MVASVGGVGAFLGGLVVGVLIGIVLAPMIGFWLRWREWRDASREAPPTDDVLDLMDSMPPWRR
ncbi:MAG TPA: hypothetical protein VMP42_06255 [Actinomycetota bacterium]|nr:hypothetical protein [Actinomycetota bacterium]